MNVCYTQGQSAKQDSLTTRLQVENFVFIYAFVCENKGRFRASIIFWASCMCGGWIFFVGHLLVIK